ncbi:MAG: primosomal protein N' [Candidatus Omnitrophota bacterium]
MFAQVVFNLPVEGPFDYLVPAGWEQNLHPGMRVEVSFGKRCSLGYVTAKVRDSNAKGVKPILRIIDKSPILGTAMLKVTRQAASYYACSWGEIIEAAVPQGLRRSRKTEFQYSGGPQEKQLKKGNLMLLHDLRGEKRWDIYFQEIHNCLAAGQGVILLAPYKGSAEAIQKKIKDKLNMEVGLLHSYQAVKEELSQWLNIKNGRLRIVAGTRLAVFAPLINPGLIIVEDEGCAVYKQDSTPHYNAVGVARIRSKIEGVRLILFSRAPALEAWYEAKRGRIKYILRDEEIPARDIKIIDTKRVGFAPQKRRLKLSFALEAAINNTLNEKGRVLLFLNRRGFAIFASCSNCAKVLRCPRCNANLILHFESDRLICHRCNYQSQPPKICPNCNRGYIQYAGLGTEKLESELHRLYPQYSIARLDKDEQALSDEAQIIISTEAIFKQAGAKFDLIGVIWPDAVLNLPDFRAAEKLFALLIHLACLSDKNMIIQTAFPEHYCFQSLSRKSLNLFYETELKFRRQSGLPPFKHIVIIRLRGAMEEKVSAAAEELFNILNNALKDKSIKIVSFSAQVPHKKRDNFYEQILIKSGSAVKAAAFLKNILPGFRRWGIIVTVDVDPV